MGWLGGGFWVGWVGGRFWVGWVGFGWVVGFGFFGLWVLVFFGLWNLHKWVAGFRNHPEQPRHAHQ